jgi:hypothetical protein
LVVEVRKNSITGSSSNDGEFDTSTTTAALSSTSATPSPVRVFTPVFGAARKASGGEDAVKASHLHLLFGPLGGWALAKGSTMNYLVG